MIAPLIGIVLVIVAVLTWIGNLTATHALAILVGAIGALVLLGGVLPASFIRRE